MNLDSHSDTSSQTFEYQPFQYSRLDSRVKQIRLIQIQPSSDSQSPILVRMKTVNLGGYYDADARRVVGCWEPAILQTASFLEEYQEQGLIDRTLVSFTTVSYVWGPPSPNFTIYAQSESCIGYLTVRENLYQYLVSKRNTNAGSVWFWIDQISIDQENWAEKNYQVALMAEIYSYSNECEIWLGLPFEGSDEAMNFTCRVGEDGYWTTSEFKAHRFALVHLMHNDYWTRLWIVQEVLLSREPVVRVGSSIATWNYHFKPAFIGLLPELRKSKVGKYIDIPMLALLLRFPVRHITWAEAVGLAEDRKCVDPRDSIYGLLGLVAHWVQIAPDYSKSLEEIFLEMLRKEAEFSAMLPQQLFVGASFEKMTQRWCRVLFDNSATDLDLRPIRRCLLLEIHPRLRELQDIRRVPKFWPTSTSAPGSGLELYPAWVVQTWFWWLFPGKSSLRWRTKILLPRWTYARRARYASSRQLDTSDESFHTSSEQS